MQTDTPSPPEAISIRDISVLAIDDDDTDLETLRRHLNKCDEYSVQFVGYRSWKSGLEALNDQSADVIFLDFFLEDTTGAELLQELRRRGDLRPVIMLTGYGDEGTATESIRFGATDYISKNKLSPDLLKRAIEMAHREYTLRRENAILEKELNTARNFEAIGNLAGGVAHDFNNILAGILASIELAQSYQPEAPVADELARVVGIVSNASEVVQRLLQFNKFYATSDEMTAVDMTKVLDDTFLILEHFCAKGIAISVKSVHTKPLWVHGSSAKLHQVLLNLCMNAIEAMELGGTLEITLDQIVLPIADGSHPTDLPPGGYIGISVSDTGPGIPPEIQDQIFQPFFTTKKLGTKKGTGLGLASAYDCVREMGGSIHLESTLDVGSTFHVYIPAHQTPLEMEAKTTEKAVLIGNHYTILLVDDEEALRETTARILRRSGHRVLCAATGTEALALLEHHADTVDVVVMDVSMPCMNGKDCLAAIRAQGNTVPVLMATGHSMLAEQGPLLALGANGVIQKPFIVSEIEQRIHAVIATS